MTVSTGQGYLQRLRGGREVWIGGERVFDVEIVAYLEPTKVMMRLTGGDLPPDGYGHEIYQLEPTARGTRLRQTFEMNHPKIGFFLRWLMWFIHRFGQPMGKKYLVRLKERVESQT